MNGKNLVHVVATYRLLRMELLLHTEYVFNDFRVKYFINRIG